MNLLNELADGALPVTQAAAVRARFTAEPALAAAYTELALVRAALDDMPAVRPPRSLKLSSQTMQHARGWRWWLISPPGGQMLPSFSLVACLALVLLFGSGYGASSQTEQISLKGAVTAPLSTDGAAAAPAPSADAVPLVASQPDSSVLPLVGVAAGLVGTAGSARWLLRTRKRTRKTA
jgi:anti-sigma factor RsiW